MKERKLSGRKPRVTFCVVIAVLVSIFVCVGTVNAARSFRGSDKKKSRVKAARSFKRSSNKKVKVKVKAKAEAPRLPLRCPGGAGDVQNDMWTGCDAGDSLMDATQIPPPTSQIIELGDYKIIIGYSLRDPNNPNFNILGTGYIDNDQEPGGDPFDYYKVWVESGQTLRVYMESINLASDYDLEFLYPNGHQIAISDNGYYNNGEIRMPEEIVWEATYSGYCIIKVYVYSLSPASTWAGFYFMYVEIVKP